MTFLLGAWTFLRTHWKLALIVAALVAVAVLKLKWTAAGKALERAAQTERNSAARREADAARTDALNSDDPRKRLRDNFGRPGEGG
jgi:hypothetical protein